MPEQTDESASQGKFGAWRKKKAQQQSKPLETNLSELDTAEGEVASEENTQERSAEL
jgi:hypothetical protein